jgi:hypothetical protein
MEIRLVIAAIVSLPAAICFASMVSAGADAASGGIGSRTIAGTPAPSTTAWRATMLSRASRNWRKTGKVFNSRAIEPR